MVMKLIAAAALISCLVWLGPQDRAIASPRREPKVLGTDPSGDQEPSYSDITKVSANQTGHHLVLRFYFRDLPLIEPPGGKVGGYVSFDGGVHRGCYIDGDLGPTHEGTLRFHGRDIPLAERYHPFRDNLVVIISMKEVGLDRGDVFTGCPLGGYTKNTCGGATTARSIWTSPTAGMYGYDGLVLKRLFPVR
jgi:hypothetical protein